MYAVCWLVIAAYVLRWCSYSAPDRAERSTVMSVSVCLCVCLSVRDHISRTILTSDLHQIFVHVTYKYGRGSVLLWRRSDTLRISGFADDVIFAHKLIGWSTSPPG